MWSVVSGLLGYLTGAGEKPVMTINMIKAQWDPYALLPLPALTFPAGGLCSPSVSLHGAAFYTNSGNPRSSHSPVLPRVLGLGRNPSKQQGPHRALY